VHQVGLPLNDYIEMHSQQNIKFNSNSFTHKHISIVIFLPRCTFILHEKNSLPIINLTVFSTYHLEYSGKCQSKNRLILKCTIWQGCLLL